jgi:transcriptional regulator with XRE-family HTH domain
MSNKKTQFTTTGSRVAEYRKIKDLSQQELADILGVSRGYIGDIERDRSDPSSNFLTLFASKLNVSADWILTGEGEMEKGKHKCPTTDLKIVKMAELLDGLNEDQQREIFTIAEEKKRFNNLERMVQQLLHVG